MGATESVFYDDAPMEAQPREMVAEPPLPLPPSDRTRPRQPMSGDEMRRRNQQQQPMVQQKPPRRRAPAQVKPIKRMEGLVLGGPKTGKRTLLSRLKGVDPFARKDPEEKQEVNPSITIQYKPSSESPTWDRIKLRIRYANSIEESMASGKKENKMESQIDFVVLMISPKNSQKTTQSYLESTLAEYLDRLGYRKAAGADTKTDSSSHEPNALSPFCIAILFNFRDLEEGENDTNSSRAALGRLVDEILRSRNVHERKVVVELLETSLLNCYGLDGLHRFIYRTYLQRCQADIERQLEVVRNQIQLTDEKNRPKTGESHDEAKAMAYDEFLKENAPVEKPPSPQHPVEQNSDPPAETSRQTEPVSRRRNFGPPRKPTAALRMGKDALEAFLASSSDEEEEAKQHSTTTSRRTRFPNTGANGYASSSSDDDSDDDFFYDESGNRRHQIYNQTSTKSAGPKEIADDEIIDSSSSEEEEDQVVSSSLTATSENPTSMQAQDTKLQKPQQTSMTNDHAEVEEASKHVELEEEVVDEEDEITEKISPTNELVKNATNENHSIVESDTADNNDTDAISLSETSSRHTKEEVDTSNDNAPSTDLNDSQHSDAAESDADDTTANGENDNINNTVTSSLNCEEDDDDDDFVINSTSAIQNDIEDDEDNDDYMINSTPTVEKAIEDEDDDDSEDDYMIDSTPVVQKVTEENDSDEDEDGYMINPENTLEGNDDDEDNDDDQIIKCTPEAKDLPMNSSPAAPQVVEDDEDDDDYMIGATNSAVVKAFEDDDDDSDGFIIGHTPMPEGNAVEEDSDNDFMIETNAAEDNNEGTKNPPKSRLADSQPTETARPGDTTPASDERLQPAVDSTPIPEKPVSGGISQAAVAAIAAAQEEAEAMMRQQQQQRQQQQYSEIPATMTKEKKSKKKKKDEKKKKKKKKTKSSDE